MASSITNHRYNRTIPAVFLLLFTLAFQTASAPDFDDLAHRAESLLDTQPAQAAILYRQALAIRPSWPEGWFYLGGALYHTGKFAEARDAFRKGIPLAENNGHAWAFLGMCEGELGDAEHALNDIDKGERLGFGKNCLSKPLCAWKPRCCSRGLRCTIARWPSSSRSARYTSTIPRSPVEGLCLFASADIPEKLSPERRKAVDLAGQAIWDASTEHPDKARKGSKLMAAYPNEPGVHYAYGLYLMESDQSAALAEFQKEIAANPRHWPSLLIAAHMETAQGSPELALKSVEEASKLAPADIAGSAKPKSDARF